MFCLNVNSFFAAVVIMYSLVATVWLYVSFNTSELSLCEVVQVNNPL